MKLAKIYRSSNTHKFRSKYFFPFICLAFTVIFTVVTFDIIFGEYLSLNSSVAVELEVTLSPVIPTVENTSDKVSVQIYSEFFREYIACIPKDQKIQDIHVVTNSFYSIIREDELNSTVRYYLTQYQNAIASNWFKSR